MRTWCESLLTQRSESWCLVLVVQELAVTPRVSGIGLPCPPVSWEGRFRFFLHGALSAELLYKISSSPDCPSDSSEEHFFPKFMIFCCHPLLPLSKAHSGPISGRYYGINSLKMSAINLGSIASWNSFVFGIFVKKVHNFYQTLKRDSWLSPPRPPPQRPDWNYRSRTSVTDLGKNTSALRKIFYKDLKSVHPLYEPFSWLLFENNFLKEKLMLYHFRRVLVK